ncbi:MAG: hypothetical protein LBO67_04200 [Spirochaetaceae bacterium]|jgi:antitoxin component YwqK of YwqJK toxin-antitoxin module|nr:hypothetical protein [Spirochaetaceae bacterium]
MALFLCIILDTVLLLNPFVYAADWYRSNAAGMTLESALSEESAKQSRYSLSIETMPASSVPSLLKLYYTPEYRSELHTLFEDGAEYSRSWHCFDADKTLRLVGTLSQTDLESFDSLAVYDSTGLLTTEYRFVNTDETLIQYHYRDQMLIRVETSLNSLPLTTDYYRYSRSKALRYIERIYHTELTQTQRLSFPYNGAPPDHSFNSSIIMTDSNFLSDVLTHVHAGGKNVYTKDEQGRILTETLYDAAGNNIGILENIWDGKRIKSMIFRSEADERLTDYEYDENGDRIAELNYNKGVLERTVRRQPGSADREIEELYYNGTVMIRAIWERGRKISEERLR